MAVKIAIIGVNALGQSLAVALKQARQDLEIHVHDRKPEVLEQLDKSLPFKPEWNLVQAIEGASIVFLNEPVHVAQETLTIIGRELRTEAVIADMAPYKSVTAAWAREVLPGNLFYVGATPLVAAVQPRADLFQQQKFAIVPLPETPEHALRLLTEAITLMGASPFYLEMTEHDALLAAIHQLPIISSAALLRVAAGSTAWRELSAMAHAPFLAATMMPEEDAEALTALLRFGREPLLRWVDGLQEELAELRALLTADNATGLQDALTEVMDTGKKWRQKVTDDDITEAALADARAEIVERSGIRRLLGLGGGDRRK